MAETLKRLLSPEYLVVANPGPMGKLWILYLALGLLLAVVLVMALWVLLGPDKESRTVEQRAWAWFELWVCLAGLGTVAGRMLGWPGWSARIWPYSLAALAIVGLLTLRFRHWHPPPWLVAQFRTLALLPWDRSQIPTPALPKSQLAFILGLLVHLLGISLVLATRFLWPVWVAPLVLLGLLAPQVLLLVRNATPPQVRALHRRPRLMTLTPLLGAYAATILWLLYRRMAITVIGWQGLSFPNPMVSLFYVDGIILAAVAFVMLCQLGVLASDLGRPSILWRWAAIGLLAITLAWAGVVYFGKRTHGATASDPYAYAQMAVDLAERGTFLHRLSLFEDVMPLDIAWAPLQPVGYHIPRNEQGDSPSVWATGASVLLALGYAILGETGLYVTTPIVALLALAATWALVQEALCGERKSVRYLTSALTVTLLATSPEYVDRLLVPMADSSAQLFTVLTLYFALRGMHQLEEGKNSLWSFLLAGICFGWAYWVRHTQLVLALPVILAAILGSRPAKPHAPLNKDPSLAAPGRWSLAIRSLLVFFGAALLSAVPDILYRWLTFGSPLSVETTEIPLMGLEHIGPVSWQMLRDALVAGEWGYLFPLAIYGGYRLARDRSREASILGSAFAAVLLVHLTYRSLRLRDLISIFPLLDLAVAYGAVTVVQMVRSLARSWGQAAELGRMVLPVAVITWVILSLSLSRWAMIDNLWKPGWASFGYMRAEHRAAFDRLAALTSVDGVIGASLNAGAVMMYTGRDAIRPYDSWTDEEWDIFLHAMRTKGRSVYLLDDGDLMADFIAGERTRHQLIPVEVLQMPLFYTRDRETGWLYRLEWDR